MWIEILIWLCAVTALFQCYLWYHISSIPHHSNDHEDVEPMPSVSVIIAAKNEEDNLFRFLPLTLSQDYEDFEVIVIDDGSSDNTLEILSRIDNKRLKVISQDHGGKKSALSNGIQAASNEWVICTDADCRPNSNQWITTMMSSHQNQDVILGYGPYEGASTWPVQFLRYETWYIALQYFRAATRDRAYMGVGRNLAFRKSTFTEVNGYQDHKDIRSGDDDLFISELHKQYRIGICLHEKAWMYSAAKESWSGLWSQKRRHLTTATRYRWGTKVWLMLVYLTHLLIYALPLLLALQGYIWMIGLIVMRWIYIMIFAQKSMTSLGIKDLFFKLPLLDFVMVIYYTLQGFVMPWQKKEW